MILEVAYTCSGTNPVDRMNVTYDALSKTGQQIKVHCINGTFVNV